MNYAYFENILLVSLNMYKYSTTLFYLLLRQKKESFAFVIPANALSSAMDLNFNTFSDSILPGRQVIDIVTKGKLLLIFFSTTKKNIGIFKCIDVICSSFVYLT
jgi:hypothetical protein